MSIIYENDYCVLYILINKHRTLIERQHKHTLPHCSLTTKYKKRSGKEKIKIFIFSSLLFDFIVFSSFNPIQIWQHRHKTNKEFNVVDKEINNYCSI